MTPLQNEHDVHHFLGKPTAFGIESGALALGEFFPGKETSEYLENEARVLVIGAGGLGCEILKCLAYSSFKKVDIIDLDTIDLTNLNRQFLFSQRDIGRMKAEVAAEYMRRKVPDMTITAHTCPIQEKPPSFFKQFTVIVAGLDNIKARRWINALLHEVMEFDDITGDLIPDSVIPLVDGGTEGLKGQTRVIIPGLTGCFECTLSMFQNANKFHSFPLCTIADKPRKPEHCVMYALLSVKKMIDKGRAIRTEFEELFGVEAEIDNDNPDHVQFVHKKALQRADVFNIAGVSYSLTLGVIKNIIPAIASTNCLIAANCVNEVFKLSTYAAPVLDNYFLYLGTSGVNTSTIRLEKKEGCPVCDATEVVVTLTSNDEGLLLKDFITLYLIQGKETGLKLERPSLAKPGQLIYMQNPESLRKQTAHHLEMKMVDLVKDGETLSVTDPLYPSGTRVDVVLRYRRE